MVIVFDVRFCSARVSGYRRLADFGQADNLGGRQATGGDALPLRTKGASIPGGAAVDQRQAHEWLPAG